MLRMCDVAFSLNAAAHYERSLNRIQLQKFIYLLDIVVLLYDLYPPLKAYKTYKHGPYDPAIQNAVDSLTFRGFARPTSISHSGTNISAEYKLTTAGKDWIDGMAEWDAFNIRSKATVNIGYKVNEIGWTKLVDLVYAEPTYVDKRSDGWGQRLDSGNAIGNSSAYLFKMIEVGLSQSSNKESVEPDLMVNLFFRYLEEYSNNN